MRFYTFTNMYLSSLQVGLQSAHCLAEMFVKYPDLEDSNWGKDHTADQQKYEMLDNWAANHKTMILLNGGYSNNLREIFHLLSQEANPYPFANFHESSEALDGALTCVGIILPERIYESVDLVKAMDKEEDMLKFSTIADELSKLQLTQFELDLCRELSKYGLAK